MDGLLSLITHRTVTLAINSGMILSAKYTWNQGRRLAKSVDPEQATELLSLQRLLKNKMQIISPAIDMIDLIAARGNTSLESAVSLTKEVRFEVQSLGQRLEKASVFAESVQKGRKASKDISMKRKEVEGIIKDTRKLLDRIEEVVPLLNLAITTSGAKLSTNLPSTVSPSRLLQASTLLSSGDTQYCMSPFQPVQIGPTFTLSVYMLFSSHRRPHGQEGVREATWKEVMHKARLKLRRVPLDLMLDQESQARRQQFPPVARADEYAYQILIVEDLDDGRVHDFENKELRPQRYEGVNSAGIREILPVHEISKLFYADTGRLLNINVEEETNNPVLLLKRDLNAIPPRRMVERDDIDLFLQEQETGSEDEEDEAKAQLQAQLNEATARATSSILSLHQESIPEQWRLPSGLDPEWIAFEVYNEDDGTDAESEEEEWPESSSSGDIVDPRLMENLSLSHGEEASHPSSSQQGMPRSTSSPRHFVATTVSNPLFNKIRTSLSLLEMLLRLTSLQQFQQQSHLSISDELLNFFLEEASSTGAGGDEQHRQRLRAEARRKVGWDPYDESPVKRRGEEYQHSYIPESSPAASYRRERDEYLSSPSYRSRSFHIRSRENTPETPLSRSSLSIPPDERRPHSLRNTTTNIGEGSRKSR